MIMSSALVTCLSFKGEFIQVNATTLEHRPSAQDVSRLVIDNRIESVQYTCHYHPCFGICVGQLGGTVTVQSQSFSFKFKSRFSQAFGLWRIRFPPVLVRTGRP